MNDYLRNRLQGIGESRLAAIGLGKPATTPTASTNPFTRARNAQQAAEAAADRASKRAALAAMPDSAIERHAAALATYRRYRDSANAIEKAHIRKHFPDLELGRQLSDLGTDTPPDAA